MPIYFISINKIEVTHGILLFIACSCVLRTMLMYLVCLHDIIMQRHYGTVFLVPRPDTHRHAAFNSFCKLTTVMSCLRNTACCFRMHVYQDITSSQVGANSHRTALTFKGRISRAHAEEITRSRSTCAMEYVQCKQIHRLYSFREYVMST